MWEKFGIADVVGMSVRNSDELYVRWLDADRGKLRLESFGARPVNVRRRIIGRIPSVGHRGDRIGDAGVPEEIAVCVVDQIAADRNVDRLSDVHANRPAGFVGGVALAAIEHVERSAVLPPDCAQTLGKKTCEAKEQAECFIGRPRSF